MSRSEYGGPPRRELVVYSTPPLVTGHWNVRDPRVERTHGHFPTSFVPDLRVSMCKTRVKGKLSLQSPGGVLVPMGLGKSCTLEPHNTFDFLRRDPRQIPDLVRDTYNLVLPLNCTLSPSCRRGTGGGGSVPTNPPPRLYDRTSTISCTHF